MPLIFNNPDCLYDSTKFGFSQSVTPDTDGGKYVYLSGQGGTKDKEYTLPNDFRTQVRLAMQNIDTILKTHDLGFHDCLKVTVLIVDHNKEKLEIWIEEMQKR
eukprot:Pgem_evm1s10267